MGLPLFEQMIPRSGLSTGRYPNTRRIGAIVPGLIAFGSAPLIAFGSAPLIAFGSVTVLGNRGIFLACAVVTAAVLVVLSAAGRRPASSPPAPTAEIDHR